jgi:rSAM/selenodomain-associated transferase 1
VEVGGVVSTGPVTVAVVFGREPIAGRVKTRLAAELGDGAAAHIYQILLDHTLEQVSRCTTSQTILSISDAASPGWRPGVDVPVEVQQSGDLGGRLAATFARRFAEGFEAVVVVGSDCAGLTATHVAAGIEELKRYATVFGPAHDGGYWLVGQRRPGSDLFSGIPWSSPHTMETTRRHMREKGMRWAELEVMRDIDTASDLDAELASGKLVSRLAVRLERAREDSS